MRETYKSYELSSRQIRTLWTTNFWHNLHMESPKDRLKQARIAAGFPTPTSVAEAFPREVNVNTIISNENGNRAISKAYANKYAKIFNVKAGWLLYGEKDDAFSSPSTVKDVPRISWVSAGQLSDHDSVERIDDFPTVQAVDLPDGAWIALTVEGDSMNKISPPGSIIFVNMKDKRLVHNACYVVADESGAATYKRYRQNEMPSFKPASYHEVKPPILNGEIRVIGRVRRTVMDM